MKVLIYIACFIALVSIQVVLNRNHIMLGAIPMVLLWSATWGTAKMLCKFWDNRTIKKKQSKKNLKKQTKKPQK